MEDLFLLCIECVFLKPCWNRNRDLNVLIRSLLNGLNEALERKTLLRCTDQEKPNFFQFFKHIANRFIWIIIAAPLYIESKRRETRRPYLFSALVFSLSSHALIKDSLFSFSRSARAISENKNNQRISYF